MTQRTISYDEALSALASHLGEVVQATFGLDDGSPALAVGGQLQRKRIEVGPLPVDMRHGVSEWFSVAGVALALPETERPCTALEHPEGVCFGLTGGLGLRFYWRRTED